ncbi:MAG: methyltransferase domain-containing protein, partial [Longimicrobiales bacterium]|nr:methyltransferase domain-containing protein [Longimicrobiales bacterium]
MAATPIESAVKDAYAEGATRRIDALCCPVDYDPSYLEAVPDEVVERDYGCGDPSRHLREGETVLDLGSGTGKICFIASQVVGPRGRVIGVDMTPEMLEVARRNAPLVAERVGYGNVEFRRGRIQDLALDLDAFDAELADEPVRDVEGLFAAQRRAEELRRTRPMIQDDSVDVVVSNCVVNLSPDKPRVLSEIFRVLKPGGELYFSDVFAGQ